MFVWLMLLSSCTTDELLQDTVRNVTVTAYSQIASEAPLTLSFPLLPITTSLSLFPLASHSA